MNFKLNFLGVTVADFEQSYRFYAEVLRVEIKHSKPGWAAFQTTGMKFELFSGGAPAPTDRSWGHGQAIRPSFHVADLKSAISKLRRNGVTFVGDIEKTVLAERIEFIAPEEIRWTLARAQNYPFAKSLRNPHIGWVEMKVHNLFEQQAFYTAVMGMRPEAGGNDQVVFRQGHGDPLLILRPGGQLVPAMQNWRQIPLFVSFETKNIQRALTWLQSYNMSVLEDIATHRWGRDFFIRDIDGNPMQIVQYT